MGIKVEFDEKEFNKKVDYEIKAQRAVILEALRQSCYEVIIKAKSLNTYLDRSNNLRSSIGFAIYVDGVQTHSYFFRSGTGTEGDGSEGIENGKRIAEEMASAYPKGIVAVILAGMNYAYAVETGNRKHGKAQAFDVISGSLLQFDKIFKDTLRADGIKI
jgi:hypothetical protein